MEELYLKIKEYVSMDTEISPGEFQSYYTVVMKKLTDDFEELSVDELIKARFVTTIMSANAASRGKRKDAHAKKFRKISEKSNFWAGAIEYKLNKMGVSDEEIEDLTEGLDTDIDISEDELDAVEDMLKIKSPLR